jgi:NitT/TauT family transport system permease protein
MSVSYPVTIRQRLYSAIFGPAVFIVASLIILKLFSLSPVAPTGVSFAILVSAVLATFWRLLLAFLLALALSVPLALLIAKNHFTERLFLPLFDISQSIPVLAFFPVVIVFFVKFNLLNGAAIFILFLSMLWNLVFSLTGGLKVIPSDIKAAAQVFHLRKFDYLSKVVLPAIFPYLVTGSLLAWAQGWNVIIVAEVLHTYIPGGTGSQDLFGIGSLLVHSIASGRNDVFLGAMLVMILVIAFLNFFIWQKLLRYAEKFKFE